jgi:hypothetical protein
MGVFPHLQGGTDRLRWSASSSYLPGKQMFAQQSSRRDIPMSFAIEMLSGEPIVVVTVNEDFDVETDTPAAGRQYAELVKTISQPVYLIVDFRAASKSLSVGSIVAGANLGIQTSFFNHPHNKEVIWVATTEIMKLAAEGMGTDTFGKLKVSVFETLEEALAYVRGQ